MKSRFLIYCRFVLKEFADPLNYLLAGAVGISLNVLQSGSAFSSAAPFLVPVLVQAFSKSAVKFRNRQRDLLVQLPRERRDPAFVMDDEGRILAATGNTARLFEEHGVKRMTDLACKDHFAELMLNAQEASERYVHECHSPVLDRWYAVTVSKPAARGEYLVWFDDISTRKHLDASLQSLRSFSSEILSSVEELAAEGDSFARLARLILGDDFKAVVITLENGDGMHSGRIYGPGENDALHSKAIQVAGESADPLLLSRKTFAMFTSSQEEFSSQEQFCENFSFTPSVRDFLGEPVHNFISYHEGPISLIAFNRLPAIEDYDRVFIKTAVNTARATNSLTQLVIKNDRKFVQSIMGLCAASEFSDEITGRHIFRVNLYSELMAKNLGMDQRAIRSIGQVAAIHDIGKVAIPHIIKLPRKLTDKERLQMEMHPVYGARILDQMMAYEEDPDPRLKMAYQIALNHHQTWAGTGYPRIMAPDGSVRLIGDPRDPAYMENRPLRGNEIPKEAMIVAIADKYDALRASRQYKDEFSHKKSLAILRHDDRSGLSGEEHFGTEIYRCFLDLQDDFNRLYEENRDHAHS